MTGPRSAARVDAPVRRELARQGRSWLLSLICVTAGALAIWWTDSLVAGAVAVVATAAVLGLLVWARSRNTSPPGADTGTQRPR